MWRQLAFEDDSLKEQDPHHWGPVNSIWEWLHKKIEPHHKVLDVGPGHCPFPRADVFVDFSPWGVNGIDDSKVIKIDFASNSLPFEDKSFDIVYCRHTLEDMWNPFHLLKEMERVGKAGYIETPSPFQELARGQDSQLLTYRGHAHHRWITWVQDGSLTFVTKYPPIEYVAVPERLIKQCLMMGPEYWNTYHYWEDKIEWKHLQSPLDYDLGQEYPAIISMAMLASMVSTHLFYRKVMECHTTS